MKKYSIVRRLVGGVLTLAAMAGLAQLLLEPPEFVLQSAARPVSSPRAEWIDIVKPFQLYAMPAALFGLEPKAFTARRHTGDGGRIDAMTYGAETPGSGPWLRMEIHRFGEAAPELVPLYASLARQASRDGASIARLALPGVEATRFGEFEVADVQLQIGEHFHSCTGFRRHIGEPGLSITGIACGTIARPVDRTALACALDRLDLVSSGDDRKLGDFFAAAELGRKQDCAGHRPIRAAELPDWLAPKPATTPAAGLPLKGSLAMAQEERPAGRRRSR